VRKLMRSVSGEGEENSSFGKRYTLFLQEQEGKRN
jgi:hypothetical protein